LSKDFRWLGQEHNQLGKVGENFQNQKEIKYSNAGPVGELIGEIK